MNLTVLDNVDPLGVGCSKCGAALGRKCFDTERINDVHQKRRDVPHVDRELKACEVALWAYRYGKYNPGGVDGDG